jgi:hypothetical protein
VGPEKLGPHGWMRRLGGPVSIDELDARRFDFDFRHLGARALTATIVGTAHAGFFSAAHHFALNDRSMTIGFTRYEETMPSHLDVGLSRRIGDLHPATHRLANSRHDAFGAHRLLGEFRGFFGEIVQVRRFRFRHGLTKLLLREGFDRLSSCRLRLQSRRRRDCWLRGLRLWCFGLRTRTECKSERGENEDFPERLHDGRSVPQKPELVTNPQAYLRRVFARSTCQLELCYNGCSNV